MKGDFLTRIRLEYNQFTKAEKKVADYILQNSREVLFMSITGLAEACEVGDTSVFRFCKTLDLKGYQEFKMRLSLSLHDETTGQGRLEGDISLRDSFQEVSRKVLNTNMSALEETYSLLNEEQFGKVIDALYEAKRICFFGVGASMISALKAANKFMRIEPKVFCLQDAHMQAMAASMMTEGEAAVFFSYSGSTKDTIHTAELAKKAGAVTICITRFLKSPLTSFADMTLLCGANEGPLQGGSTSSEISQLFLIDLMYTEYYRRYFEQCDRNNEKVSASVLDKMC
ncbi:MurR/RpiR family transcriptional regulator [Lacrimispora aerotolerans]|jgi:DNA-binding MurR/RpiR family transcriptional regulator|uniref:MurR/RpiR family transcriptional regulator n=1 Tax=Lacrimispora aerotolerans TaxID=36832 RepID=UPI00047B15DF|nr:MurR/RpiR family transcriptional regulator [Lacrimispora aerotolerans]